MHKYIQDLKGIKNKEGKVIKPNILFRSAELSEMKKNEIDFFKSIKIKKIIDLRFPTEVEKTPDYKFDNCIYHFYSILDTDITAATHSKSTKEKLDTLIEMDDLETTYEYFFTSKHCLNEIKKTIRDIVLNDEFPVDYHCVTGKDRTGIITMLLLSILDVDKETIVKAYLYPKKFYIVKAYFLAFLTYLATKDKELYKKAKQMYYVSDNLILRSMKTIDNNYGSMKKFISDFLEISDEEIKIFKERVLE